MDSMKLVTKMMPIINRLTCMDFVSLEAEKVRRCVSHLYKGMSSSHPSEIIIPLYIRINVEVNSPPKEKRNETMLVITTPNPMDKTLSSIPFDLIPALDSANAPVV